MTCFIWCFFFIESPWNNYPVINVLIFVLMYLTFESSFLRTDISSSCWSESNVQQIRVLVLILCDYKNSSGCTCPYSLHCVMCTAAHQINNEGSCSWQTHTNTHRKWIIEFDSLTQTHTMGSRTWISTSWNLVDKISHHSNQSVNNRKSRERLWIPNVENNQLSFCLPGADS